MEYLIGMIVTTAAFGLLMWAVNRKSPSNYDSLLEHWRISNEQAKIKNDTLKRIADALENQAARTQWREVK